MRAVHALNSAEKANNRLTLVDNSACLYAESPSNSAARHSIAADSESAPSAARRSSTITAHLLALLHGAAAGCVVLGLTCATALVLVDVIAGKPTWLWLTKAILLGVAVAVLAVFSWRAHRAIADMARGDA